LLSKYFSKRTTTTLVVAIALTTATLFAPTAASAASGLPAKCKPSNDCILWAVPTGTDPIAGQTESVLALSGDELSKGLSLLQKRSSASTDSELVQIRERAQQGALDEARARIEDWFTARADGRSSSSAAGTSAGAGVGSVSSDLWSWQSSTTFGMNTTVYGSIAEYWRQYLSEPSNSTTNRFLIDFNRTSGVSFNVTSITTQCREDKFTDSNCPSSPAMGNMGGSYGFSFYPDRYWTAPRNSQKRFLNFHYSVKWSNASYTWTTTNYTTYRFNCGFSLPYCSYTGSS
jgi:hypothetical protein